MMSGGGHDADRLVGFFTTDRDLVVRSWDPVLEAMTGIAAAAVKGRPLDAIVPDLARRGLADLIREPLASGATQILAPALHRYLVRCPPAAPSAEFDTMQQRVVVTPLGTGRDVVGLAFSVEDVTARMALERRLGRELRDADPAVRRAAVDALAALDEVGGDSPLTAALGDDDWQIRRLAVAGLVHRPGADLARSLVAALRDGHRDFNLLSSAIKLLTVTGIDAAAALVALLADADADVRIQAALALGSQRHPEAVEALLQALGDPDVNVRFHAIEALGKIGAPVAVEPLAATLAARDFFLSFAAIDALVRIGDPAAAAHVRPLLDDPVLAAAAAEALGQLGDEDAVPALAGALDRADAPVGALVDALVAIHARYEQTSGAALQIEDLVRRSLRAGGADRMLVEVGRATGGGLRNLVTVLGWIRGEAVDRALADLLGNTTVNHQVIEALVRFGNPMVDVLVDQLARDEVDTRRAAVAALGRIGDRRAVPALVALLEADDRPLLVSAAGALARIGDGRAFEPLLALVGDHDVAVRQAAVAALNSIGHASLPDRVGPLLDAADRNVREAAVRIAGYFGYPGCAERLLARAADPDEGVRAAALEHLPYLDHPRVADVLVEAVGRETPRARAAAAHALAAIDTPAAAAALRGALDDPDAWVRYFAAVSLGRRRDSQAFPALAALARADTAQPVRAAAIEALGAIGGDAAVEVLSAAADGPDDDLAVAALRALGSAGADRGVRALKRALGSASVVRRAGAAQALAGASQAEAVDALRWTALADADPSVWRAAIAALAAIATRRGALEEAAIDALVNVGLAPARAAAAADALASLPPAAIPALGGALARADARERLFAIDVLARIARPEASTHVVRALDDADPRVRQRAIGALARLGTRGIGRRLAAIAHRDESPVVRRTAELALARTGDA